MMLAINLMREYLNVTPLMQLLSKATKRILEVRQQLELFQDPQ